eukprot:CAMPEP_0119364830 /NCGR_PEP_ID=MMETSP1334-20130426/11757_1 /TAXON_ID=127549 /ORGANISM="Calcidiscus leptoporus, Strain RCC1130" /LENGTH=33 /DNA_ID= /DNA_START= /DNA_END= /DNA_ORIENTATION=
MQEFEKQNEMMGAAAMTCTMQPLEGQSMRDTHK